MNRKGDLPTYFLIFVALILSGIAVYVFSTADAQVSKNPLSQGVYVVQGVNILEKVIQKQSERVMIEVISKSNDLENTDGMKQDFISGMGKYELTLDNTNFYGRIRQGDFEMQIDSGGYVISVDEVFIKSEKEASRVSLNKDMIFKFDSFGNLRKDL